MLDIRPGRLMQMLMIKRHLLLPVLLALLPAGAGLADEPDSGSVQLQLPPDSLAQWYKPINKRQVWLHTMFRLRQALQAVEIYAARGDGPRLVQWAEELRARYAELPHMVPEWEEVIRQGAAQAVLDDARRGDIAALEESTRRLERKCTGCHRRWKGVVTALYRAPDYAGVAVPAHAGEAATEYPESMERLADTLNRLKIAREDGELEEARRATEVLGRQLSQLKQSCSTCHREVASAERILGEATFATLDALGDALREPHDPRESGHQLGTLGFTVCGRCHSIHRTLSDLRTRLFD